MKFLNQLIDWITVKKQTPILLLASAHVKIPNRPFHIGYRHPLFTPDPISHRVSHTRQTPTIATLVVCAR